MKQFDSFTWLTLTHRSTPLLTRRQQQNQTRLLSWTSSTTNITRRGCSFSKGLSRSRETETGWHWHRCRSTRVRCDAKSPNRLATFGRI